MIREFKADRCYYWLDEEGRLCVAMAYENVSLIGDYGKQEVAMSLVLGQMPTNTARDYPLNTRSLRMIARVGATHTRWASLAGIAAVWRDPSGCLRGRFRMSAKQQRFHIAFGWSANSRALLVGDVRAIPDEIEGRKILERTEADGMKRTKPRSAKTAAAAR